MIVSWKGTEKTYTVYHDDNKTKILSFDIAEIPGQSKVITIRNIYGRIEFVFCDSKPEAVRLIAEALMEVYKQSQEAKEVNPWKD